MRARAAAFGIEIAQQAGRCRQPRGRILDQRQGRFDTARARGQQRRGGVRVQERRQQARMEGQIDARVEAAEVDPLQAVHHAGHPVRQRAAVRPFVLVAVEDCRQRQQAGLAGAGLLEDTFGPRQHPARMQGPHLAQRYAMPVPEPGLGVDQAGGQPAHPEAPGLRAPAPHHGGSAAQQQPGERRMGIGIAVQRGGLVVPAVPLGDAGGAFDQRAAFGLAQQRPCPVLEEFAEQGVEHIASIGAAPLDEQVAAVQVFQQARGGGVAGQLRGIASRAVGQAGQLQQQVLGSGRQAIDDFAGKVAKQRIASIKRQARLAAAGAQAAQHGDADRPAVGEPQPFLCGGRFVRAQPRQRTRFVLVQAQGVPAQPRKTSFEFHARQACRRRLAPEREHRHLRRHFGEGGCEQFAGAVPVRLVQIVEHQHGAGRQARIESAEVRACEAPALVRTMAVRPDRSRQRQAARCFVEEEEQRGGIGVAGVDLEPDRRCRDARQVAGGERGLAGAGRRGQPDHRMVAAQVVEEGEQAWARQRRVQARRRQLGVGRQALLPRVLPRVLMPRPGCREGRAPVHVCLCRSVGSGHAYWEVCVPAWDSLAKVVYTIHDAGPPSHHCIDGTYGNFQEREPGPRGQG
ncbi:hypothetical protein G4G28_11980 [Massilia sp. Dwa41.01b]|uniref:hypothetical protein n=1 Tax=Massilia sp. Dwa41.01b TaxID=2709302 RepID=UPI001861D1EA|nr:hypothetical protein G4G28_11980 [Massilia sp. Dwa41.01b]